MSHEEALDLEENSSLEQGGEEASDEKDNFGLSSLDDKGEVQRRREEKRLERREREGKWEGRDIEEDLVLQGKELKEKGNKAYGCGDYKEAFSLYGEALDILPCAHPSGGGGVGGSGIEFSVATELRAACHCNRAACLFVLQLWEDALWDCDGALELKPDYQKALARRATVLEKLGLLEDSLADFTALSKEDPLYLVRDVERIRSLIAARDEKLKVRASEYHLVVAFGFTHVFPPPPPLSLLPFSSSLPPPLPPPPPIPFRCTTLPSET